MRARLHDGQIFCTTPRRPHPADGTNPGVRSRPGWWSKPCPFRVLSLSDPRENIATAPAAKHGRHAGQWSELPWAAETLLWGLRFGSRAAARRAQRSSVRMKPAAGVWPASQIRSSSLTHTTRRSPSGRADDQSRSRRRDNVCSDNRGVRRATKLPVTKLHMLFSPTMMHTGDVPTLDLFSLSSLAPDTGDNVGGTLLHINTFNLHRALSTRRQSAQAR